MAVRSLVLRATIPISVIEEVVGRLPATVEAAIYFCCAKAIPERDEARR
jgi:hypothetical protein